MSFNVCPVATVKSSLERVWALLSQPEAYGQWWDAHTDSVIPPGKAQPGQLIRAHSRALGVSWQVHIRVAGVDAIHHELDLVTALPLGITILNHIKVISVDGGTCRVSFG